ncbi:MAG: hypothetical protein M1816_000070 [Peltula sp. TS41687]|nr:MAG: hypothetical protein M1816_000070 [Peltula sp. TS41687]
MSSKAGIAVLKQQSSWPYWPRWAPLFSTPHSCLHHRSAHNDRTPSTQLSLGRKPIQHRSLSSSSSTIHRQSPQPLTFPSTTPKAPLSGRALEEISKLKQIRPPMLGKRIAQAIPPTGRDGAFTGPGNSGTDVTHAFNHYKDQVPASQSFYELGKWAGDSSSDMMRPPGPAIASTSTTSTITGYDGSPIPLNTSSTPPVADYEKRRVELPPLRLGPSLGRSVSIEHTGGMELTRGLNLLKAKISQNQIKNDQMRQRFYERPGLKRKRLRSQRWRRKFMVGFRAMVGQVQHMRRQGW